MKKNKGFTLIEILITITIIGILSTITILSYNNYIKLSNEAATKQETIQLAQVFEIGIINNDFAHSSEEIEYNTLKESYKKITGVDIPFTSEQVSYSNNTLTLKKRDVVVTYDFINKKMELSEQTE